MGDLNDFLANVSLQIKDQVSPENQTIDYKLSFKDGEKDIQIFSFTQNLLPISQIPIKVINYEIQVVKSNQEFSQEVLEIDQNYLKSTSISNLDLVTQDDSLPVWILHDFQQNKVRLWGKFPSDFRDSTFEINLFDKKTRLFSKDVNITLKALDTSLEGSNYFLHFIFIGITVMIIFVVLVKLFIRSPKHPHKEPTESQESVLTNSILQWNKKMVEKYRRQSTLNNEDNKFTQDVSYQEFKEDKQDMNISREHLSEICRKEEQEGSGFIDENPFN